MTGERGALLSRYEDTERKRDAIVEQMTVRAKDRITFTLTCGMEIEA